MTAGDVDAYMAGLEEPKRSTLEGLRRSIRAVAPEAEECISYGMPAFRIDGNVVAGVAAFKSISRTCRTAAKCFRISATASPPTSGRKARSTSRSTNRLPDDLVRSLVDAKLAILRR